MNQQDYTGYIHSTSEQVQSVSERAQSHGQVQFGGGQTQSSDSSTAIQMLKNKNKPREKIKPEDLRSSFTDKERQKREAEKGLEAIRRFNQVNEEVKELHDKQVAKTKQRSEDMKNLMLEAEAKYHPDLDLRSSFTDQSKDLDLRNSFIDQSEDSDRDSDRDSSDDFVYVQKPKTNKFKCEESNEELTQKNSHRHTQSLKHKKNVRLYNRNKIVESANEDGIKFTNEDIEQKVNEQYSELEGIKYCDSCDMYLDNNTAYNKHVATLKHKNNVRLNDGEIIKNGDKFDCITCKTSLSQYSVEQHFKTKMHLDNVVGITKDNDNDRDSSSYCDICNTRYGNKNEHNESDHHKENVKQKKLTDRKWREKVNELGLDHKMKHNQIIIMSSEHEDPKFLNILESLHNIHPYIKFNFDVVTYTKPTDDQIEENEFTFRLMTRQYNGPNDLDMLNSELETRMQEQEMNQSGWSMQRFIKRTMYIHRFYPTGGCTTELPFTSRYILNIKNTDKKCLLWCLIAYLHPAKDHSYRVINYNKPKYIDEIKLPNGVTPPYDYYHLKKIQELNKDKVLFNVFNLIKKKTINPVLINHNDSKGCNILFWDNHYFLYNDVSFLLRKSTKHKCYPCLKCCVSFRTEDALNKHLEMCNNTGRRTFHKDEYLKFDKFHYKNRVPFAMYYDFECIIKYGKHLPIACGLYLRSDYPDILEDKYEGYCGEKVVEWFVERVDYYNKLFKDIFSINIPMKEETITPLYSICYYCNEEMGEDVVRDHDHLNGKFRGYAHNKCNLQAKNNIVPMYAFISSNYDNHLFITKLAKKTRVKVLTKTDENYISIDMGYVKALDMFRFFHPLSLDAISKTLSNEECITLNKYGLERRKGIFPYEWFDSIDKLHETALALPPKEAFYSKLKQSDITDKEYKQAIDCWKDTKCETIKDYMMLYLKTDVLLSVDVFEKFRAMCLEYYEIDPCYTYSTTGLT